MEKLVNKTVAKANEAITQVTPSLVTLQHVKSDPEATALIKKADEYLGVVGYTDHGIDHATRVSDGAYKIINALGLPEREADLAAIAGFLHDIGNVIHRNSHAYISALLAHNILTRMRMPINEVAVVMGAIGNHDEEDGDPINNPCAALIIADKSDVLRTRVRNPNMINFDIHDRVNYAVESSELLVEKDKHLITLKLKIDTSISQVMEYFEIFLDRMLISRRSAQYLNCDFHLVVNDSRLT